MKTILRNAVTGLFFQGLADWTEQLEAAFDFQCPERVVRFVRNAALDPCQLELVLAFENSRFNLTLPLDERFGVKKTGPKRGRPAHADHPPLVRKRVAASGAGGRSLPPSRPCPRGVVQNRL